MLYYLTITHNRKTAFSMNNLYFFTITLKPVMYHHDVDKQHDETINEILLNLTMLCNKSCDYTIVCELTKAFNIHYHGIIDLTNSTKRKFINIFRNSSKTGFVNISLINDLSKTVEYIAKSIPQTHIDVGRRPIIKDDLNLLKHIDNYLTYSLNF